MNDPLLDISYHRAEEAGLRNKLLLPLRNERSWTWTACRSAVLPVGGLQESLAFLILGVGRLKEDQLVYYVETRENMFFHNMGTLRGEEKDKATRKMQNRVVLLHLLDVWRWFGRSSAGRMLRPGVIVSGLC